MWFTIKLICVVSQKDGPFVEFQLSVSSIEPKKGPTHERTSPTSLWVLFHYRKQPTIDGSSFPVPVYAHISRDRGAVTHVGLPMRTSCACGTPNPSVSRAIL